ncbi:reverse transcriptase domain-containing protein [Tanacetum coccineum]
MAPKRAPRSTPVTENPTTTTVTNAQLQAMIDQGVTAALTARDANRNGDDSHTSGTGVRRNERVARECTYPDFMKCQPLYFKGTEGVVELTQWFERMETVFRISNCSADNQIKFSTCTLLAGALTWWNSHVRTVGHDVAYVMTWTDLKKKMTDKYCPRNEIKKLEAELWNLKVKGTDVIGYNQRFQELALLCVRMFPEESDKIYMKWTDYNAVQAYAAGTRDGNKTRTRWGPDPQTRIDCGIPELTGDGDGESSNYKTGDGEGMGITEIPGPYIWQKIPESPWGSPIPIGDGDGDVNRFPDGDGDGDGDEAKKRGWGWKEYAGTLPLCNKCKFHHNGPCTVKCANCKRVGHLTRDCWSSTATNNQRTLTCYDCGNQGHYRSDCPELKNGNQARGTETRGRVLALVGGETNQDLDDMKDNTNA